MSNGKIFITGPGRSGSTFLVQLLTRLGFDTGYKPYEERYHPAIRAGCEWTIAFVGLSPAQQRVNLDRSPRIIKGPEWSNWLKDIFANDLCKVDHVLIPLRDLRVAAQSRLDAGLYYMTDGTLDDQESVHAFLLGKCIEACELYDVPYTIMRFPKLVTNSAYCWDKLKQAARWELQETNSRFVQEFDKLSNPENIKWNHQ